jgi:NADPH:quinone reductase-like Zn-dependent oxidoreductase
MTQPLPTTFEGIGYTRDGDSLPLQAVRVPVPRPNADQVLIQVACSSINPLEYKLAQLNFFHRKPPVILGFDLAGTVVAVGAAVTRFAVGDEVAAMAACNGDGGWATGGSGGYALASEFLTVKKPRALSFRRAAVLPLVFNSAYLSLQEHLHRGDSVYIPGGAGGVGHLALQMAAHVYGCARVMTSAGTPQTIAAARSFGATHVFNYKEDDIGAEIRRLTDGKGVDLVFDATYSEESFVRTSQMVRRGGTWVVLGVGPGHTTRTTTTASPVDDLLAKAGARHVNANMLRFFSEPGALDGKARALLQQGLVQAMEWAADGRVVPHIGKTIDCSVEAVNAELQRMKSGQGGVVGKVAVVVDRSRGGDEAADTPR